MKKVLCLLIMTNLIILSTTGCFGDMDSEYCKADGCVREALDDYSYCAEHNNVETDSTEYEENYSDYYKNEDANTNGILGSWINTNNNGIWTFKEDEYIMDYSSAFPGDYSDDAIKVRQLDPIHVPCQIEGNYLIYTMSGVSYRNRFDISGNTLTIINSVSGQSTTYKRK